MTDSATKSRPDFICVGLEKSGTTWLHRSLSYHPDVFLPPFKEVSYFYECEQPVNTGRFDRFTQDHWRSRQKQAYRQNLPRKYARKILAGQRGLLSEFNWDMRYLYGTYSDAWYASLFPDTPGVVSGDISPAYAALTPEGRAHMRRVVPEARIILLLREPVDWVWSKIRSNVIRATGRTLDQVPEAELNAALDDAHRSFPNYGELVRIWQEDFGSDRVFVGYYDEISHDPQAFFDKACEYIGVDPSRLPETRRDALAQKVHEGIDITCPDTVKRRMTELFLPGMESFAESSESPYPTQWRDAARSVLG